MKTKERLAEALTAVNAPVEMIQRALDGYYDDYESPSAVPIMMLISDATKNGLSNIAKRAREGEFDATDEESREWLSKNRRENFP